MRKTDKIEIFANALRYTDPYTEWRDDVIKEQGNCCQICGARTRVHVHHLKYFRSIVKEFLSRYDHLDMIRDKDELLNCAEFYDDFWDPDNGLVLCNTCHEFEHINLLLEDD